MQNISDDYYGEKSLRMEKFLFALQKMAQKAKEEEGTLKQPFQQVLKGDVQLKIIAEEPIN